MAKDNQIYKNQNTQKNRKEDKRVGSVKYCPFFHRVISTGMIRGLFGSGTTQKG